MTRDTISPIHSGSPMASKGDCHTPIGQYPRVSPVPAVARALGIEPSYAAQLLKPADPRSPFARAAMIVEVLYESGNGATADALLLPLDLVREAAKPHTDQCVLALMDAEQQADGEEDRAQIAYAAEPSAVTLDTWIKAGKRYYARFLATVRVGLARHGAL